MKRAIFITFGRREYGVLRPVQKLSFDRIVVFTNKENDALPVLEERTATFPKEIVYVDAFDIWDVYSRVVEKIQEYRDGLPEKDGKMEHYETVAVASGGTHLLRTGMILAGWKTSSPTYAATEYGDVVAVPRIPVESIKTTLNMGKGDKTAMKVLRSIPREGQTLSEFEANAGEEKKKFLDMLTHLEKAGLVDIRKGKETQIIPTGKGLFVREFDV